MSAETAFQQEVRFQVNAFFFRNVFDKEHITWHPGPRCHCQCQWDRAPPSPCQELCLPLKPLCGNTEMFYKSTTHAAGCCPGCLLAQTAARLGTAAGLWDSNGELGLGLQPPTALCSGQLQEVLPGTVSLVRF